MDVFCPIPSGLASGPLRTSGYSRHTPEIELIKMGVVGYLAHH